MNWDDWECLISKGIDLSGNIWHEDWHSLGYFDSEKCNKLIIANYIAEVVPDSKILRMFEGITNSLANKPAWFKGSKQIHCFWLEALSHNKNLFTFLWQDITMIFWHIHELDNLLENNYFINSENKKKTALSSVSAFLESTHCRFVKVIDKKRKKKISIVASKDWLLKLIN